MTEPSTRVYKQLQAEVGPDPAQVRDALLRLALVCMALDPTSSLTPDQRRWVKALKDRAAPFTTGERARLKAPILAWIAEKMPRCTEVIQRQFGEDAT
jgi:hypothetical protein